jgi:hypothetical protein
MPTIEDERFRPCAPIGEATMQIDHGVARSEPLHDRQQIQRGQRNPIAQLRIIARRRRPILFKRLKRAMIEGLECRVVGRKAEQQCSGRIAWFGAPIGMYACGALRQRAHLLTRSGD